MEGHNFDIRKHLLEYDDVMNQQRTVIYRMRRNIMDLKKVERQSLDFLSETVSFILDSYVGENVKVEQWDLKGLTRAVYQQFGISLSEQEDMVSLVQAEVKKNYDLKKEEMAEHFKPVSQLILLQTLDARWKEHLENIDRLKEGINLRAYAQKDPLVEYKKESFALFERMNFQVASESIEKFFKLKIQVNDQEDYQVQSDYDEEKLSYARPQVSLTPPPSTERGGSERGGPERGGPPAPPRWNRAERRRQKQNLKKAKIKI